MTQGSYPRKINYALRPAKSIERKMLTEAFACLSSFGLVSAYRYVGFGSPFFSDFILFHRTLGISNMISIEEDVEHRDRFVFNRPFSCIQLEFGSSNEILPRLSWDPRTILWLDYEGHVDQGVLADVDFFCASASPGSMLVITVNVHLGEPMERVLAKLKELVGNRVPPNIEERDLTGWQVGKVCRRIIDTRIRESVMKRNGLLPPGSKMVYEQLFNFHYQDSSKMLTVGGLLYDEGQSGLASACGFDNLPFIKKNSDPYYIEVPSLTLREIRHLDSQLPHIKSTGLAAAAIGPDDLQRFAKIYRYFPSFVEAEL